MVKVSIYLELLIFYLIFLGMALFIPGSEINEVIKIILTVTSFLFAILLGFATADRRKRLDVLRTTLRNDDAKLIGIYESSKVFDKSVTDKIRKLIDDYLVIQLDYKLVDYNRSSPPLLKLYDFIIRLETKNKLEEVAKGHMLSNIQDSMKNQKEVIYAATDGMMFFEWIVLILLTGIILFCLTYLNTDELFSIVVIPIIDLSLIVLLLILRDLNNLEWQEDKWIWVPLTDLFTELDLRPYINKADLPKRNLKVNKIMKGVKEYRLVTFPHKYPDMSGKKIEIVKVV
ncbi:MAG: hypothetical protein ABIF88_02825 [archaeon]